jgi:Fe2+ transport system protein FeoA
MSIMTFDGGVRLSALTRGQRGHVVRVLAHDRACAHRLAAFGVTPGAAVTVLQTFPGTIFQCDETELAIELDVARSIVVEVI